MTTDALHVLINGDCSWCQGPHQQTPLALTIEDFHQTRADHPAALHMRWPVDGETTRSLTLLTHERVPLARRLLRWWERRRASSRWLRW